MASRGSEKVAVSRVSLTISEFKIFSRLLKRMTTSAVADGKPKYPKRDALRQIEIAVQERWQSEKIFEVDAPMPGDQLQDKFMGTFPYPYMNGRLHLGHTFTLSKLEFATGYERLQGKRALFPFAFHCTGMPIKACADKLKREVEMFGKLFENYAPQTEEPVQETVESVDPTKIQKKHSKAIAKKGVEKFQFQIMESMGVPLEEIHKFADPVHWLYYFPPLAKQDLIAAGMKIDWRRAFITTDVNPYYDSFVSWQFRKLKKSRPIKIDFGERYTIFSALDGQACMDHDRSTGEGVGVQEYTGIKLQVLLNEIEKTSDTVKGKLVGQTLKSLQQVIGSRKVYMVAATLRPETMYGQTNCYVGVDLDYGLYHVNDQEAWICTERAAKNMAWQGLFTGLTKGELRKLADLKGWDLVGVPLKAPLAAFDKVYTLPMEGVLANKGTGVVTSVPSDAPDDYITLLDLQKKAAYYNVDPKWITPFLPPKPIISTPNYGNLAAVKAVEDLKIQSQKDKTLLAEAKDKVYKEGFYNGTIIVGEYSGTPVQQAKPLIKAKLIAQNEAFVYCEPEGLVISRSGDECVVTLADQWYMNYGETEWREQAKLCLSRMELFSDEIRNNFERTLDWLGQWACSRSFGLGTRLPWDPQFLIESLSDSTIYMAYYTVAHFLQSKDIDGSKGGLLNIRPEQMTDEVWDFIFSDGPMPTTQIPKEHLELMKREFDYFYPLDLRVSGKDLISNHLTFFIYNHVALFPEEKWPKAIRPNGHLLLNGEKMSKSTGNFMTLQDAIQVYGADSTRFAFADAGDAVEDANFVDKTANQATLRLYAEKEWIELVLKSLDQMRSGAYNWADLVFLSEIQKITAEADKAYKNMLYRDALKASFYDLQAARSEYRKMTSLDVTCEEEKFDGMHRDVAIKFIKVQALILSPICPHWAEYVWSDLLKESSSVCNARWPVFEQPIDHNLLSAALYLRTLMSRIRAAEDAALKKRQKKGLGAVETGNRKLILYVADSYPEWQENALSVLKETFNKETGQFTNSETALLGKRGMLKDKRVMPFIANMKKTIGEVGFSGFDRSLQFDEVATLEANLDFIVRELSPIKVTSAEFVLIKNATDLSKFEASSPGAPNYEIL